MRIFSRKIKPDAGAAEQAILANSNKLAGKVQNDAMPSYHDLFTEDMITPAKIKTAIDSYRRTGKLQGLSNIMDLLLDSDDNLQSKILVRKAPIKRAVWSYGTELPTAQAEFYDALIKANLSNWVDEFMEGKLKGWQFQQVMYELNEGLYYPTELLTYSNLDLRKISKRLAIYEKDKPVALPDYKFISILYRRPTLHSLLKYYVFYAYALNHWAQFVETYGKPPRIGKYDPMSTPKEVEVLKSAVKALGTDQAAIISKNTEIEFKDFVGKDSSRTLYESLCAFVTSRVTNAILGQTLTTEQGETGTYAQARVHDAVQEDIVDSDLTDFSEFVNTILRYANAINFAGPDPDVYFEVFKPVDLSQRIVIDEKLVGLGLEISEDHFYDTYNVDRPGKGQKVVKPVGRDDGVVNTETRRHRETEVNTEGTEGTETEGWALRRAPVQGLVRNGVRTYIEDLQAEIRGCKNLKELKGIDWHKYARLIGNDLASEVVQAYVAKRQGKKKNNGLPEIRFEWDEGSIQTVNAFRNQAHVISAVRVGESFNALWDQAAQIVETGGNFQDFIAEATLAGFAPENPYHLRTEYDTAIAAAQMRGRWAEIDQDKEIFPYLRYVTMRDEKVRDEHIILDGTVAGVDDVFWLENYPPNGYNCRCDVEQLTENEALGEAGFGKSKPVLGQAEEFKQNVGVTDTIPSDAYAKLWEYAERVIDGLPVRSNSALVSNAKLGDIIQDALNYPVRLSGDIDPEQVAKVITSPAEIWANDKYKASYIKKIDEAVVQVITNKGLIERVETFGSYQNEGREGVRIYGV